MPVASVDGVPRAGGVTGGRFSWVKIHVAPPCDLQGRLRPPVSPYNWTLRRVCTTLFGCSNARQIGLAGASLRCRASGIGRSVPQKSGVPFLSGFVDFPPGDVLPEDSKPATSPNLAGLVAPKNRRLNFNPSGFALGQGRPQKNSEVQIGSYWWRGASKSQCACSLNSQPWISVCW